MVFESYAKTLLESGEALVVVDRTENRIVGCSRFYVFPDQPESISIGFTFLHHSRGRQDLELTLLAVATVVCLILFLMQRARAIIALALSSLQWLCLVQHGDPAMPGSFSGLIAAIHAGPLPSPALGLYNLPIQI